MIFSDFMEKAMESLTGTFFGQNSTFTPLTGDPVENVKVVLSHEIVIAPPDFETQLAVTGTVLEALYDVVGEPVQGDIFTVDAGEDDAGTWTVEQLLENNGNLVKVHVNGG